MGEYLQCSDIKFERELIWCIEQLELGLSRQKPDSKQAREGKRILKMLSDPKAPLVKKRQAMRSTFCDYRKKMADEEKKLVASSAKNVSVRVAADTKQQRFTFYKKARSTGDADLCDPNASEAPLFETTRDTMFKFHFNTETVPNTVDLPNESEDTRKDGEQKQLNGNKPMFESSDNSFRFNFQIEQPM
ncbi:PREDICTED: UPF0488 protein C8orf33 homolog [Priapulus caudatus]|uniref:UPF0488 protein C8orf33 homolog n=1 Tax=Priapulus caudatus TaxID=37621 RepID=A0ABM1F941_PRICU|nr:PREDICTED: UPF0488 protein C8orf33 homolog [Priapulus caudatus]